MDWWLWAGISFAVAGVCGWGGWTIAFRAGERSREAAFQDLRAQMERALAKKDAEFAALLKLRVEEAARHRDQEHLSSVEIAKLIGEKHQLAEQIIRLRGGRGQSLN